MCCKHTRSPHARVTPGICMSRQDYVCMLCNVCKPTCKELNLILHLQALQIHQIHFCDAFRKKWQGEAASGPASCTLFPTWPFISKLWNDFLWQNILQILNSQNKPTCEYSKHLLVRSAWKCLQSRMSVDLKTGSHNGELKPISEGDEQGLPLLGYSIVASVVPCRVLWRTGIGRTQLHCIAKANQLTGNFCQHTLCQGFFGALMCGKRS